MRNPLNHFQFAQFQFVLQTIDSIHLPAYKGSTFRGAFGYAFKKVVCVNREKICGICLLKGKCVYSYVFETPPPPETSKMKKYPFAPHPFVITPPLEEKRGYQIGETFSFELTLIGKSIDYLPYFIYTFDELGKIGIGKGKGKYHLQEVRVINLGERFKVKGVRKEKCDEMSKIKSEETMQIYSGDNKTLRNRFKVLNVSDLLTSTSYIQSLPNLSPNILHLRFLTPTRMKFDGRLSPQLEFNILIRNLLRRISLLSYFHCGEELNLDFKGLIERSKAIKVKKTNLSWVDWERYSNRQETKMKMGGFVGSITFEGDVQPFLPFILLGEYVHVGKGTSFGLGKYEIVRAEN